MCSSDCIHAPSFAGCTEIHKHSHTHTHISTNSWRLSYGTGHTHMHPQTLTFYVYRYSHVSWREKCSNAWRIVLVQVIHTHTHKHLHCIYMYLRKTNGEDALDGVYLRCVAVCCSVLQCAATYLHVPLRD